MEINCDYLKKSLHNLKCAVKIDDKSLKELLRLPGSSQNYVKKIFDYLIEKLLDHNYTKPIGVCFKNYVLLLVTTVMQVGEVDSNYGTYQKKCIALATLSENAPEVLRYARKYFADKPSPFNEPYQDPTPKKRTKNDSLETTDILLIKSCYTLLSCDPIYFKDLWDWSIFIEKYFNKGCSLQKLYANHIMAILTNMTSVQLKSLNENIPEEVVIKFDLDLKKNIEITENNEISNDSNMMVRWNFPGEAVINIEGVLLPIYNKENSRFYSIPGENKESIVNVDSTKINLRSIALGISSGKAVCLTGPVGCGKTTLVEYLARKTGRVFPKQLQEEKFNQLKADKCYDSKKVPLNVNGNKRKGTEINNTTLEEDFFAGINYNEFESNNGFLRIQLGDQTDSKMLLGQYRCTDVPGEFIWSPGVLTQAVMNGCWLLLEDLDSATQDTFNILSNLLENNFLSVPGFRDCVKIEPGFQLFATVRTQKSKNNSQKTIFSLLEKYLYSVNILPLSRRELCEIVSINYPKLSTIANRIVDVYLTFSSGNHVAEDSIRQQELEENSTNKKDYIALPFEKVSVSSLPNSGRLVSTRDLMKLCHRSNPMFSVTSAECAYFVFQNAADVFCSYLPESTEKTMLIVSIGAKLGIIQSRCEFFSNEYKPEIQVNDSLITAGRAELHTKVLSVDYIEHNINGNFEISNPCKKVKLSHNSDKTLVRMRRKETTGTFSFTRITSCLLEKIAVCVNQNEPILLVGETGVGKTSSVQYLAEKSFHKLVVVNMNNQSDVSDLVGGFKPVDLSYVLAPLRSDFEHLFRKTFNETKNEKFLSKISICYNQNNFPVLIKAMIAIVDTVFQRARNGDFSKNNRYRDYLGKWRHLQTKLLKLDSQLAKSINISFAFIPGSLVNCIKNGDWVLLDEINLASAETLECLSTILEPDGSIVLLEKGDFTPVKRHPNFRIFACMNPNTDIGKKDLPVGIRNRFTEFFVDELTTESDLILLVNDYLSNTGIKKAKVFSIVKLYKKLKSLSRLELNDGLGNRPVYSLRTLCRALTICAKNLCGSVERNLYESFCLSFLTQLDPVSHKIVLELIKGTMLSNVKAVLSQPIPKPGENYLNFEGYWIEKGPKEVLECDNYILTDSVKENLKDLARIISIGKLPVLLQGPTSAGKTSLIEYVAKKSGNHYLRINNHEHTDLQEYIGAYTSDETGKLSFKEGVLAQAMRNGFWIILDELNLASTDILEALNRVLDDNRELFIAETQTTIRAHQNFMLFATQNPPGLYGGRKTLSRAFKNRFIELHFSEIPKTELEIILEKRCFIPKSYSQKMVKCMSDLQVNRKSTTRNNFTLRDLFRWGNRYTYANKKLLENNLYDWNQHLVDEGYLVLSAKVRTEIEVSIIEETLFNNFRKKISVQNLYSFNENTSLVTKHILEKIHNYRKRSDIIWTQNMTRMAVLTAKALEFNEPVLLVGPTGCGKTTVCQVLADINERNLRILNCHMHTEGADFLGGLRPYRNSSNEAEQNKLFEWSDGPLVISMLDGSYFMADEISLAEDSVLERLNSVLEPERTVLLAEKGGINSTVDSEVLSKVAKEFVIQACDGFQFLGTMNPGGDFGKKELSPALRNRFTEIWCKPSDSMDDLVRISSNALQIKSSMQREIEVQKLATVLVEVVFNLKNTVEKFKFSVRDILAWANYITQNMENEDLSLAEILVFGLETIFLDSLEMLLHESLNSAEKTKNSVLEFAIMKIKSVLHIDTNRKDIEAKKGSSVQYGTSFFGIKPFFIKTNSAAAAGEKSINFSFEAPTTRKNLFRLLSALSLQKAILLEGPPGVGKTSTVENLALAIGYKIVRINLCEHTDLADLFGTDLPAEEKAFEIRPADENPTEPSKLGSFSWRDGPLLAALKSENTWILLDELNLAPQSVLEGLNAILDHRGEVFIPELNRTFVLGKKTRIFACQNPLRQGGGRKGLPQSFLNRFTKVYLRKLNTEDLLYVVDEKYSSFFSELQYYFDYFFENIELDSDKTSLFDVMNVRQSLVTTPVKRKSKVEIDLSKKMVKFSEILDKGISDLEFGYKGGPFEINLRDIMRWCDLLVSPNTGFITKTQALEKEDILPNLYKNFDNFLLILFERMKLVYYQRMRSEADKTFVCNAFRIAFNCDIEKLRILSEDIGLYWTDSAIYLNDIVIKRDSVGNFINSTLERDKEIHYQSLAPLKSSQFFPLILSSQRELLKNLAECVHMEKPVILCGPTDSGKTKIVDVLCTVSNQACNFDTIDDSVTGSFQQIDLNRHLEEVSQNVTSIFTILAQRLTLKVNHNINSSVDRNNLIELFNLWKKYSDIATSNNDANELILFRRRIESLNKLIEKIISIENFKTLISALKALQAVLLALKRVVKNAESLNTGGHFEWVDSKIVKSLKYGQYICLEHVNLCSAAILDRLNPVFEPNGNLLLSEKGVMIGDDAEIVEKHENFRAFLTMDPKNGELSRAMRNRCIEISLAKDSYSIDDLKIMIYESGIQEIYLVNTLLNIHQQIKDLSELSNFSISHLMHFSFLVSSYKRMGYDDKKAIYVSGMEVYVYPSNVDLLGYGLLYYQTKIKDIIKSESELICKKENQCNLGNLVITCSKLNSLSMIEKVCEPLNVMLRCYPDILLVSNHLGELKHDLKERTYENYFDLVKSYMCLLYEASSLEDVSKRNEYIKFVLNSNINMRNKQDKEFLKLNDTFLEAIKNAASKFELYPKSLPWNTKLFSRIRDYKTDLKVDKKHELRLSAILFSEVLIESITEQNVSKLSTMSALAYSQAVTEKNINDSLNNSFLKYLYGFLKNLKPLIISAFNYIDLDTQQYISILVSLLWINRLYTCSRECLFKDKVLNNDLIDKLILHFKWIEKHLLKTLEQLLRNYKQLHRELDDNFKKLKDYTRNTDRPLNLLKKTYYKFSTNFIPFYAEEQITNHELRKKFENLIALVPSFGNFSQDQLIKKFSAILTDESQKIKQTLLKGKPECLQHIQNIEVTNVDFSILMQQNLETSLRDLGTCVEKIYFEEANIDIEGIQNDISKLKQICDLDEETKENFNSIQLKVLPLREYFLVKGFVRAQRHGFVPLNQIYCDEIPSLNLHARDAFNILSSIPYNKFQELYLNILSYINGVENSHKFEELLKGITAVNYRHLSTFHRIVVNIVQTYQLTSLSARNDVCNVLHCKEGVEAEVPFNGPSLTTCIVNLAFQPDGQFTPVALSDINLWKDQLSEVRQLLWNNSNLIADEEKESADNLKMALLNSNKLLVEVQYVQKLCKNIGNDDFSDYNENFQKLIEKLNHQRGAASDFLENCNTKMHQSSRLQLNVFHLSLINSLVGCIEICLLTFTPLIDPVEKNRLKNEYIRQDFSCLKTLTDAYDIMRAVVEYKNYGAEIYNEIKAKIEFCEEKKIKLCKKLALRPKDCLYSTLVQDINHFLQTNCDPKTFLSLVLNIEECWHDDADKQEIHIDARLLKIDETVKRIDLWIGNAHRFLHHTLNKYSLYYNDFVQPVECAIGMITFGYVGLKTVLEQKRNFIANFLELNLYHLDKRSLIPSAFENIMKYPSIEELHIFDNNFKSKSEQLVILEKFENSSLLCFNLLKAKLFEIKNCLEISAEIDEPIFNELSNILKVMNQMWEEEEDRRRKQKVEEESLYINKIRCQTEDEEQVELQEVQENFPTYVEEDFGQFIQQDTLEQVIKTSKTESKSSKIINLFNETELKVIGENFIYIMEHFSRLYYYTPIREKSRQQDLDVITPFKIRLDVFVKLFNQYKSCLNEWVDECLYNTFGLVIGLHQDSLNQISITPKNSADVFNFYKDSNISEIISCTEVLDQIEVRTKEQSALYPDHAILNDIINVIQKIRSLPATSPVVRFNTGFQILRQKISQWNEVAHKNNHLRDLEAQVAEYVQRWTRLELQFWRNCLVQSYEKVESEAYKYWFFIYNLLHEYLAENDTNSVYTDFICIEKKFKDREINDESDKSTKIQTSDIVNVLRQFVEASNYADYFVRIKLLRAFELYLHYFYIENNDRKEALISILHNLQIYFDQFRPEIEDSVKSMRTPIEKKLREFVKIESYNKDLSYFSMKNNIARVHRNLNKFLKEYQNLLKTKISKVFQQKENSSNDYHLDHDKGINLRYDAKIKYYMIDVKNFIASQKLKDQFVTINDNPASSILKRVDKLFITSRNVVKQAILHAEYPSLIYSLDLLLTEQIETCEHLRKLEVDRSQEKAKQKNQAKTILQQKRKALSDLYKTLTNLGISYKSGLMEISMESELTDNEIAPFCVKTMFKVTKYKKLDQNLIYLSENLDNYFAKCVFKLKLLQNIMLTPNSELGPLNTDRMKGFSVDMFLLIQKQRKMLSVSIKELYDLRTIISDVTALFDSAKACDFNEDQLDFDGTTKNLEQIKTALCKICYVLEQFNLLIKCAPEKTDKKNLVLGIDELAISQENSIYKTATEKTQEILKTTKNMLKEISKLSKLEFVGYNKVVDLFKDLDITTNKIIEVRNLFEIENGEFLPASKPLSNLITFLGDIRKNDYVSEDLEEPPDVDKLSTVLENIVHSILLSLQKLFKKYSEKDSKVEEKNDDVSPKKQEDEESQSIQENHIREKIHKELSLDLETLNAFNIIQKLSNILVAIKYTKIPNKGDYIKKIASIVPMLEQFTLIGDYFIFQQLGAHKVTTKMLSILLTVFVELGTKGFCIPPDLMQDEEGEKQKENKGGEGFGLEDGTGQNDVSDKIESEDQLDDAKRPEDRENKQEENEDNCKEEKGIEMSEDFDGKMQDIEKPEDDEDNENEDEDEELNKEMGETEEGAEKLDDQIWGSDEENNDSEDEEDMSDEETGKGTKDEDDAHNNLDSKNDANEHGTEEQQEGLDATDENNSDKEKKQKKNDIDNMQDPELDEEQVNPYHNELEEPPEPEDMDLGDNCNVDEDNIKDDENQEGENPFDIDKMKENMQEPEEETVSENDENKENDQKNEAEEDQSDSEPEPEAGGKRDNEKEDAENEEEKNDDNEKLEQNRGEIDAEEQDSESEAQKEEPEKQEDEKLEDLQQSKDKSSKEENVQSMPDDNPKGSDDQIQNTENEKDIKQDEDMDAQDTGEDKEGVGVAENDISDRGHQGIAETKETKASEKKEKNSNIKEKRSQKKANEERTLGEPDKNQVKQLKTIGKLKEQSQNEETMEEDKEIEADEYQHVKEPKKNDKTTLDSATEDQSKQIQHLEDQEDDKNKEEENNDAEMEVDDNDENENDLEDIPNIQSEHSEQKSEKPSKSDQSKDKCETTEKMEVEGDIVETLIVPRSDDTTAHCIKDILMDTSASEDITTAESLELRKLYQDQLMANKNILPRHGDYEMWQTISSKMLPNARDLCEQLRLILEPTKCTRLKGDYRTGRRINMKKIIPYIASQFRKDKIWLRRTKPAQRDYKITIAIDDSKSMHHNNSKTLTLQAISLISQALTLLESGKLSIVSFGESPQIILNHTEQFEGPKLVKSLNFAQNQSKIAELLNFVRTANSEEGSSGSDNELFENLLIVLSDGRNIYSEGEQKVRDSIKLARLQRIFLVYIIIDNPDNKHSILDIRVPQFSSDKKTIVMKSYLDVFPFPYYIIVRDLGQLPIVLSEAMRQWFELVNSEQ